MPERLLSTIDISKIIGVHHSTVARWINKDGLRSYKTFGGHNRVKHKDLLKFVKENNIPYSEESLQTDKTKVLIVDDDESVLKVLAGGLRKSEDEFVVETATDGFQAGQIMERISPDVVILDIFLPGLDGIQVCKMIKDGHPDIRIIVITGHGSEEVEKKIMEAGADVYLQKPFELEDLAVHVRGLIDGMVSKAT